MYQHLYDIMIPPAALLQGYNANEIIFLPQENAHSGLNRVLPVDLLP